ncbi:MAG: PSD1 and planctomycete cytochrome C domain-containing protein [Gemmataceae bacterium]|nr:PSD1 and planctomycete cytochrome C domain-containing protein [Gemmataceae bacterium]
MTRIIACAAIAALATASLVTRAHEQAAPSPASVVDFNRDIRPILSENCFVCHGPDEEQRKVKLRLDTQEGAFGKLRRGGHAIVPGKSADSELIYRVTAESPTERMPPPKTNKKLTPQQIDLLKRWIDQGATYSRHWAFVAPKRPSLPKVNTAWPRNGIDHFILARLESAKLQPSPEADRVALIRRLTLDLTGLPPTPREVDAFLADKSPEAYEKVVDRLLSSPHYGERMALDWLDAARFADTHGYHIDSGRDMTRWREWVIDAFNRDMPFDQFTVEQLAGDLLPDATLSQKIASGFNRNHMINFEGGAIPDEYLNNYIVDRVNTTATVWLGLTMTCAQCHDHKYDPISQKEFYQLYAFFNNVPESGLDGAKGNAAPLLPLPTKEQSEALAKLDSEIDSLSASVKKADAAAAKEQKDQLARLQKERDKLRHQIPSTMVMQDIAKPRDTHLLVRGEYNKKAGKVQAGVPAALTPLPKDAPLNRLGLARWLVDPAHPLMTRVIVNRYWQLFFGTGLVKTVEDFGAQGELPSHPDLLDWLAVEFVQPSPVRAAPVKKRDSAGDDNKLTWSTKRLVRLIVTSATYRQSSKVTPALVSRDPENRLLARGPRFRLQAEFIRDQALAVSGLLNREIGGKSVSPYQPTGLWQELHSRGDSKNWSAQFFEQSKGKDLYRRTMYTFWKRTSPPPQLATFDAPDREVCTVRRSRTNTPLQALVLMNDPTYVEAARKLAERLLKEAKTTDDRLTLAFRLATARTPSDKELGVLRGVLEKQLARYRQNEEAALKLLSVGESPRDARFAPAELAAWTMVSSVILNLDETITKG